MAKSLLKVHIRICLVADSSIFLPDYPNGCRLSYLFIFTSDT